jgi:hypothetical protein
MGVPTSEVGYTSATTGRGDNEVHKGNVVAKKTHAVGKMTVLLSVKITIPVCKKLCIGVCCKWTDR